MLVFRKHFTCWVRHWLDFSFLFDFVTWLEAMDLNHIEIFFHFTFSGTHQKHCSFWCVSHMQALNSLILPSPHPTLRFFRVIVLCHSSIHILLFMDLPCCHIYIVLYRAPYLKISRVVCLLCGIYVCKEIETLKRNWLIIKERQYIYTIKMMCMGLLCRSPIVQ